MSFSQLLHYGALEHFSVHVVDGLAFHLLLHIEIYCVRDFMLLYNPSFCNLNVSVLTVLFICYLGFGIVCWKQLFQPLCYFEFKFSLGFFYTIFWSTCILKFLLIYFKTSKSVDKYILKTDERKNREKT